MIGKVDVTLREQQEVILDMTHRELTRLQHSRTIHRFELVSLYVNLWTSGKHVILLTGMTFMKTPLDAQEICEHDQKLV